MAGVEGMAGTFRDPRLASALKSFREDSGVTGEQVAAAVRWSPSKISRIELGRSGISEQGLEQLLGYYMRRCGMPGSQAAQLRQLGAMAAARTAGPFAAYLANANLASAIMQWSPVHVPKLLQVPDYVAGALASRQPIFQYPPGLRREMAAAIAYWQTRLTEDPPMRLRAVIDESVLYRRVGSPGVMRAQLRHLDRIGNEEDTDVQIRVLSLDGGGPAEVSPFSYLEYPEAAGLSAPPAILVDDLEGLRIPDMSEAAVWKRFLTFEQLWGAAEEPGPVIKRALHDAWPETG